MTRCLSACQTLIGAFVLATALPAAAADATAVMVGDPYAYAVPPGQRSTAAYMTLTNDSGQDRAVVAAESPAVESVEIHTHLHEDGMMRMRRVDRLDLPAGEKVALEPGGLHLMLIGLRETLAPGDSVEFTLELDDGSRIPVQAEVRKIEPR